MVVKTFMDMDQDSEEEKELYLNLALHLASDFFLKHPDKDVRLLVACCLADIFRIYAPEAPYTSPDKLKVCYWRRLCSTRITHRFNYITQLHLLWGIYFTLADWFQPPFLAWGLTRLKPYRASKHTHYTLINIQWHDMYTLILVCSAFSLFFNWNWHLAWEPL